MTVPNLQTDVVTSYRVEPSFGSLASNDSTARTFPANTGGGMSLEKRPIANNRIRSDLQTARPRHGARAVAGTLASDFSVGTFDPILEAAWRSTYVTALTSGSFTFSYDSSTGTLTRGSGSFVGEGFRVGDTITPSVAVGGNSGKPAVIIALPTATTATIGNKDTWVSATSVTGVTVTRGRKLLMGGAPVARSFSIEHWQAGITLSERFVGCRLASIGWTFPQEGPVGFETSWVGQDMRPVETARFFTSATNADATPIVTPDVRIFFNGVEALNVQALSFGWDMNITPSAAVGSLTAYQIPDGNTTVAGSISFWRTGSSNLAAFGAESGPWHMQVLMRPPGANDYTCLNFPAFTLGAATPTERIGPSGAQVETCALLVGPGSGANFDASMMTLTTSSV